MPMGEPPPASERERELRTIQATYDRYRREDRHRLWSPNNPGFARMMRDRDNSIVDILRRSEGVDARILDLGSGDGRLAQVARDAGIPIASWSGVDLDPVSVAEAAAAYPWAEFHEASADDLPFAGHSFDAVVAATLFSSLPSHPLEEAVAAEIGRVLHPTGTLVWYDLRFGNPRNTAVHGVSSRRLAELFPGWTAELRSTTLLPPVARRLGRLTGALYATLEALPPLRSHLIGRIRPAAHVQA